MLLEAMVRQSQCELKLALVCSILQRLGCANR